MSGWEVRDAGDSALLLDLEPVIDAGVNARAIAAAQAVRRERPPGVRDVVSTYRSVAVHFDPRRTDVARLRAALAQAIAAPAAEAQGRLLEVPISYGGPDGPDLAGLAAAAGLSMSDVAARHAGAVYRVFMIGFLPGFAYMGLVEPSISAPRHPTPRLRVPAGSVGIAGRQTGIYPIESPGGWQIIGRTPLRMFDPSAPSPSLLRAGDSVRFVPMAGAARDRPTTEDEGQPAARNRTPRDRLPARRCTVLRPGLFSTVQDRGRWGFQRFGVPVAGALDVHAHDRANAIVGNDPEAASFEVTIQGPELRFEAPARLAIAGADLDATLDGDPCPLDRAVSCRAGGVLRFGARVRGARAYVAVAGGLDVPRLLGSRSTHVRTRMGGLSGRALRAGDWLPIGSATGDGRPIAGGPDRPIRRSAFGATGAAGVRLRVLPGPQAHVFGDAAFERLQASRFVIAPASDRMGYRLVAPRPIPATIAGEMISDATFPGAIQVPPSGHPILLLADRQTTGGYPQIAVVIAADLPLAGQLVPGDWIELRVCSRGEAIRALDSLPWGGRGGE